MAGLPLLGLGLGLEGGLFPSNHFTEMKSTHRVSTLSDITANSDWLIHIERIHARARPIWVGHVLVYDSQGFSSRHAPCKHETNLMTNPGICEKTIS